MSMTIESQTVTGIERIEGVCGGYPVIAGTRISVRNVVEHLRVSGGDMVELLRMYPHVTRERLEAALVYYARFPGIVDEDIERNQQAWRELTGTEPDADPAVHG